MDGEHIVTGSRDLSHHADCLVWYSPRGSVVSFVIHGNSSDALYNPIKPIVSSLWLSRCRRGTKGAVGLLEHSRHLRLRCVCQRESKVIKSCCSTTLSDMQGTHPFHLNVCNLELKLFIFIVSYCTFRFLQVERISSLRGRFRQEFIAFFYFY